MKLFIFPEPLDSACVLTLDNGNTIIGVSDVHSSGRKGQSFTLPENSPNGNGALLRISKDKKVILVQRGILYTFDSLVHPDAMLTADDFRLQDEKICPEPVPVPPNPNPNPIPNPDPLDPFGIILSTQAKEHHDLSTKKAVVLSYLLKQKNIMTCLLKKAVVN
jgi:hypothetical protein